MIAFFDGRCPKCDKKFGWTGELVDRPPCPRCQHQIPKSELEETQKEMDDFEKLLIEREEKKKASKK